MKRPTAPSAHPPASAALLALLAALALLLTPPAASVAADGPSLNAYSLVAQVDYASSSLQVDQTVRFRNRTGQPLDRAVLQVTSAWYGAFSLQAATVQGRPVAANLDGTVLELPFATPLAPGASLELGLTFGLVVPSEPGRLSAGPRALALGNWFPILAVHRGDWDRHQYVDVGDSFVTEVADFDLRLTTSVPLTVASTGRLVEGAPGGTSFRLQAQGVRDLGLSLAPDYVIAETRAGPTVVRAYAFSQDRAQVYADAAARYLGWYGQRFAPYPYRQFSVAEVDLPASYGGMEYPGLIFISGALGLPSPFPGSQSDTLIGHETAHQWFYSYVGNDQVVDPWLDEAFASYLPYYYLRDQFPDSYEALWTNGILATVAERARAAGSLPVDSTIDDFTDDAPYFTIVYRQGGRFLDLLRQTVGDAAFEAALAEEIAVFGHKLASPRAVLDIFQRHTNANLNPLINRFFNYDTFADPAPATWRVDQPDGPWRGRASLAVQAEFPVARVQVWLDNRLLADGPRSALNLDLKGLEPGDYALLVRVWDQRGVQFERASRVSVAS